MYEELKEESFIQSVGTPLVEIRANSRTGCSFFFETDLGGWTVFEMRWDPIDYMAVVRRVSYPEVGSHYTHFAVLEATWRLGEQFSLANRGKRSLQWEGHGVITAIYTSVNHTTVASPGFHALSTIATQAWPNSSGSLTPLVLRVEPEHQQLFSFISHY